MSKLRNISINYSKLVAAGKAGHSSFSRHSNGDIYVNVSVWDNDEENQWGQNVSMILNSDKDHKETEPRQYIGNGKRVGSSATSNSATSPLVAEEDGDVPF